MQPPMKKSVYMTDCRKACLMMFSACILIIIIVIISVCNGYFTLIDKCAPFTFHLYWSFSFYCSINESQSCWPIRFVHISIKWGKYTNKNTYVNVYICFKKKQSMNTQKIMNALWKLLFCRLYLSLASHFHDHMIMQG